MQAPALLPSCFQLLLQSFNGTHLPGDHGVLRGVDRCQPKAWALTCADLLQLLSGPIGHRQHGALVCQGFGGPGSGGHDLQRRLQGQEAPHHCRRVLAQGMASASHRLDIHSHQRLRQGILHHEERWLHDRRLLKLLLRFILRKGIPKEQRPQVVAQQLWRGQDLAALICDLLEERDLLVEATRHAQILAALSWEDKGHGRALLGVVQLLQLLQFREVLLQGLGGFLDLSPIWHHQGLP
mmetsp:Transcript_44934/g.106804  ORF Transcript_44934/g.106804 Transcript_44934/m.106804 type:complete len:239 (-) Transcript_44934:4367-5083(-)